MVPRGRDGGRDSQGVWDGHGHTAVFNMESQQGPAGQHRGLCSVSCGSLDGRGVWGRRDPCPCMAESLCCLSEIITRLLISYEGEGEVTQSCLTLCDPVDCNLLGFSIHGILQTRILEWIAISFFRGSSRPRDQTRVSHIGGRCFNL